MKQLFASLLLLTQKTCYFFFVFGFLLFNNHAKSQPVDYWCATQDIPGEPPVDRGANCTSSGADFLNKYRMPGFWKPVNNTPVKTILITFVICLKSDSTGGWQDNQYSRDRLQVLIDQVNEVYSNVQLKGYPSTCPPVDFEESPVDSKIRFEIYDIIFKPNDLYHNMDIWGTPIGLGILFDDIHTQDPNTKNTLMHIFTDPPTNTGGWGKMDVYNGLTYIITKTSLYQSDPAFSFHHEHLTHEYGHALGLKHQYYDGSSYPDYLNTGHFDFLDDVWGECPEPWEMTCSGCNPPSANVCAFTCFYDLFPPPYPLMGGRGPNDYISTKQEGRMHRTLSLFNNTFALWTPNMHNYVKEKYSYYLPYEINTNETWDFAIKMYQDIVVKPGKILTIQCEVRMPVDGKIIVEPGGTLIIDGGVITSAHDQLWQGIEVWGNRDQHQYAISGQYYQGRLIMQNGGVIENAREGIVLFNPNDGSNGYYTSGGIVQAVNSTIRNVQRGAQFISYENFNPASNSPTNNVSYFTNCVFETTQDLLGGALPSSFVTMWDVKGVRFNGCTFQNINPTTGAPNQTGRGIYTENAHFIVQDYCPAGCTTSTKTTFKNLWVGAWPTQAGGNKNYTIRRSAFENCQIGIVSDGVSNMTIYDNNFTIGNHPTGASSVHVGLDLVNTITGFTVTDNQFTESSGSASQFTFGIWNYNTGTNNKVIRKNTFANMYVGIQAEKLNRESVFGTSGLEFQCNTHASGDYDFFITDGSTQNSGYGVKRNQGSSTTPAGNIFSNNSNVPVEGDYYNHSSNSINYYYYNGDPAQNPLYYTVNNIIKTTSLANVNCSTSGGGTKSLATLSSEFITIDQQYQSYRSMLSSLIDGGNTSSLKIEVNTSTQNETMALRQELLGTSPYLSEEVLKTAADRTDVLPESILLEILLANPDVLYSNDLIKYLKEKAVPLPEWMMDVLENSKGEVTMRTILESGMSYYHSLRSEVIKEIITQYEGTDSLYNEQEIRGWYAQYSNYQADYSVVESFVREGNYQAATDFLATIGSDDDLKEWEAADLENYTNFMNFYLNMLQRGKHEHQLDSTEVAALTQIANMSDEYTGSMRARNILNFFYHYNYWLEPTLPENSPKSHTHKPVIVPSSYKEHVDVYPVPATDWVSFSYRMKPDVQDAVLELINNMGMIIYQVQINGPAGVQVIDVSRFKAGIYGYRLIAEGERIFSGNIVIN